MAQVEKVGQERGTIQWAGCRHVKRSCLRECSHYRDAPRLQWSPWKYTCVSQSTTDVRLSAFRGLTPLSLRSDRYKDRHLPSDSIQASLSLFHARVTLHPKFNLYTPSETPVVACQCSAILRNCTSHVVRRKALKLHILAPQNNTWATTI